MAWIEFHQSLKDHPKLYAACESLKISRPQMAGHLAFLWTWAIDYAIDGDLTRFAASQIAAAAAWEGDPDAFIRALVTHGFLDNPRQHRPRLVIHDWFDFCGELVKKRVSRRTERQTNSANVRQILPKRAKSPPTNRTNRTVPTNNKAAAPLASPPEPPYKRPDPKTEPLRTLVFAYKIKKGFPPEDRTWDRQVWPRASKAGKLILEAFDGNLRAAVNCLESLADEYDKKGLDWTLETIEKHCLEWKLKNGGYANGATGRERVFGDFTGRRTTIKTPRSGGLVAAREVIAGMGNLPHVPPRDGGAEGLQGSGHGRSPEFMGEKKLEKEPDRGTGA